MKVAVYGGSFDPLHIGHLSILRFLSKHFDRVLMVVSPQNPLKGEEKLQNSADRLEAVRSALGRHPDLASNVFVEDIEYSLPRPNYMAGTLDALARRSPADRFTLAIGADNLECMRQWMDYSRILLQYGVLVFPRPGYDAGKARGNLLSENPRYRIKIASAPLVDISSSRIRAIFQWFSLNSPGAGSELVFSNPYELIVAVVLSAQCTDKRINAVTPALFAKYPDVDALAAASQQDVLELIKSVSYPRSKAEHLCGMAKKIKEDFGGVVPGEEKDLVTLPGVGQKTACVVSSILYGNPVIAVDTHVFRVSHRLGLSRGKTPLEVRSDLEALVEPALRPKAHHWLLLHGRYVCTAKNPRCFECALKGLCPEYSKGEK